MAKRVPSADLKFRAFSDETRLRILHLLLRGEMCVCDLVEVISVPQPTASRHLAYLKKAGLVTAEKRGLWIYYSLTPAKNELHRNLISCVKNCFKEVAAIRKDSKKRETIKHSRNCC